MKTQILAAIGETELQPAALLAANDRVKYVFSLLQIALAHADHPDGTVARIADDIHMMAAPVLATKPDGLSARIGGLLAALPAALFGAGSDLMDPAAVAAMMQAGHDGPDSVHRLVMDLHKRINAMQATLATELLDGAAVYGLAAADRVLVSAFMAGLNRTAKLKLTHPGLATTATRAGGRLLIQNDIGTTDAHVIVIHVQDLVVSVTYTDVHGERLAFFQDMLKAHAGAWDSPRTAVLAAGAPFYMATGHIEAEDMEGCRATLDLLGSRLVFLIDWNRARKQLRAFLRGPDLLALLRSAAETGIGHRGFLELGGAKLVNQAIEAVAGSSMSFGDRLGDVLGDAETLEFMGFAVRAATEGMAMAAGILTASGGRTSHAAVVAPQLGKVCLVACPELTIDLEHRQCRIGATALNEGDPLSLDGNTGAVYAGRLTPATERPDRALAAIALWRPAAAA